MNSATKRSARPAIVLTAEDHLLLSRAVDGAGERLADLAEALARELDRARILPPGGIQAIMSGLAAASPSGTRGPARKAPSRSCALKRPTSTPGGSRS